MRLRRRGFLLLTLLALVLSATMVTVLWQRVQTTSLAAVEAEWRFWTPVMTGVRLSLIALIAAFWHPITRIFVKRDALRAEYPAPLIAQRWRVVMWLMVLELILGQEMLNRFYGV